MSGFFLEINVNMAFILYLQYITFILHGNIYVTLKMDFLKLSVPTMIVMPVTINLLVIVSVSILYQTIT